MHMQGIATDPLAAHTPPSRGQPLLWTRCTPILSRSTRQAVAASRYERRLPPRPNKRRDRVARATRSNPPFRECCVIRPLVDRIRLPLAPARGGWGPAHAPANGGPRVGFVVLSPHAPRRRARWLSRRRMGACASGAVRSLDPVAICAARC
ncbi:hypothetical protein BC834DRAFT_875612 [Gloeopeniophorella convolvens]|nr:hypothetical protein BC834DRAFT_875612 [Gloeopeniophorella convolvens]